MPSRPLTSGLSTTIWRPQQSRIEHIRPIRRGEKDHAFIRLETVHLHEELIQSLLTLIVPTAQPGTPMSPDGVDLIDEDDARCVRFPLLEQVPYPAGSDPDEHLYEIRSGHGEERSIGLAGHCPRQKRLPGSRWPDEQCSFWKSSAEPAEFGRILEEFDDLLEIFLRLIGPCDVRKCDLRRVAGK